MMKHKSVQTLIAVGLLITMILSLTACGGRKEPMTGKEFKRFMEEKGLEVIDQTESAANDDYQYVFVALDREKYSFEYYFMRNDTTAENLYAYAVENVHSQYENKNGSAFTEVKHGKKGDFSMSASDYYVRVIRHANAVLYVTAYPDAKAECKEIIKEIGY